MTMGAPENKVFADAVFVSVDVSWVSVESGWVAGASKAKMVLRWCPTVGNKCCMAVDSITVLYSVYTHCTHCSSGAFRVLYWYLNILTPMAKTTAEVHISDMHHGHQEQQTSRRRKSKATVSTRSQQPPTTATAVPKHIWLDKHILAVTFDQLKVTLLHTLCLFHSSGFKKPTNSLHFPLLEANLSWPSCNFGKLFCMERPVAESSSPPPTTATIITTHHHHHHHHHHRPSSSSSSPPIITTHHHHHHRHPYNHHNHHRHDVCYHPCDLPCHHLLHHHQQQQLLQRSMRILAAPSSKCNKRILNQWGNPGNPARELLCRADTLCLDHSTGFGTSVHWIAREACRNSVLLIPGFWNRWIFILQICSSTKPWWCQCVKSSPSRISSTAGCQLKNV